MDRTSSGIDEAARESRLDSAPVADGRRDGPRAADAAAPVGEPDRPAGRPPGGGPEVRQRWRITFAREEMAPERVGRHLLEDWHDALRSSPLPIATTDGDGNRPRLAFGAPLPASARGEAELVDVWLLERLPLWRLRESLADRLPRGHRWVSGEDIWLGAPPLPGQVTAAEWRVAIATSADRLSVLAQAARALLAAGSLPREREKGGVVRAYDLRPLLADIGLRSEGPIRDNDATSAMDRAALRIVTRLDPTLGTGRPEEIVTALAERAGIAIEIRSLTRERLILNEPAGAGRPSSSRASTSRRQRR